MEEKIIPAQSSHKKSSFIQRRRKNNQVEVHTEVVQTVIQESDTIIRSSSKRVSPKAKIENGLDLIQSPISETVSEHKEEKDYKNEIEFFNTFPYRHLVNSLWKQHPLTIEAIKGIYEDYILIDSFLGKSNLSIQNIISILEGLSVQPILEQVIESALQYRVKHNSNPKIDKSMACELYLLGKILSRYRGREDLDELCSKFKSELLNLKIPQKEEEIKDKILEFLTDFPASEALTSEFSSLSQLIDTYIVLLEQVSNKNSFVHNFLTFLRKNNPASTVNLGEIIAHEIKKYRYISNYMESNGTNVDSLIHLLSALLDELYKIPGKKPPLRQESQETYSLDFKTSVHESLKQLKDALVNLKANKEPIDQCKRLIKAFKQSLAIHSSEA